jgi:hypothetical protein
LLLLIAHDSPDTVFNPAVADVSVPVLFSGEPVGAVCDPLSA